MPLIVHEMLSCTYFPPEQQPIPGQLVWPRLFTARACSSLNSRTALWGHTGQPCLPVHQVLALSGSRARGNVSGLEPWLWLPSLGFPLPTICRQGSQQRHQSPLEACLLPQGDTWIQTLPVPVHRLVIGRREQPFCKIRNQQKLPPSRWRLCCQGCPRAPEHQANPPNALQRPRI